MPNISAAELNQMRLSGQVIRTEKLLTILKQYDFETRRSDGGTSHIVYWHPDYPEISPEVVVAGTGNVLYQRFVIDSCLKAIELSEKINLRNSAFLAPNFEKSAVTVPGKSPYELPENFEIIRGRKKHSLYLRHKSHPQIATELLNHTHGQDVSEWCGYLEERAQKLDSVIKEAVEQHDFQKTRYPNGTIVLMHPKNEDAYVVLPPFTPRLENFKCISKVEDCILIVQSFKQDYDKHMHGWVEAHNLKLLPVEKEGRRTYEFTDGFRRDKPLYATISTTRNGYFSYIDYLRFTDDIERQSWDNYKTILLQRSGIKTKKLADGRIHGKHVFADIEFTIPNFAAIKIDQKLKDYLSLTKDERKNLTEKYLHDADRRRDAENEINKAIAKANEINVRLCTDLYSLTESSLSTLKTNDNFTFGELARIRAFDKIGSRHIEFDVVFLISKIDTLNYVGKDLMVVPRPEDLERLKQFAKATPKLNTSLSQRPAAILPAEEFKKKSVLALMEADQPLIRPNFLKSGTSIVPDFLDKKI